MKGFLKFLIVCASIFYIICDVLGFLFIPAIMTLAGILNSYPPQYYVITLGAYLGLILVIEVVLHFVFKAFDKKFTPFAQRTVQKILDLFSAQR